MKKLFLLFTLLFTCLFTSCASTTVENSALEIKEYKPGFYSITVNSIANKDTAFQNAIDKTEELNFLFFSFIWNGLTLSFCPVNSQYDLIYWRGNEYDTKYYDTRNGEIKVAPYYKCVNDILCELKMELEEIYDPNYYSDSNFDKTKVYREDNNTLKDRQNFLNLILPEGFTDYSFFYITKDDNYKWYYPLKKINLYHCNLDGVKLLCDFAYDGNKSSCDYTDKDFVYENWGIRVKNGYFSSAGFLSQDYKVYKSLVERYKSNYTPSEYFVIEYKYGLSCKVYCIYFFSDTLDKRVSVTEVFQF